MEKISRIIRKMKIAIAVFAKTPGLSPVKTRLAADIGASCAETFYRLCVKAVEEIVLRVKVISDDAITPYWAIAEKQGVNFGIWNRLPVLWTGDGGLGDRLSAVYRILLKQYDSVILLGTDSPQLKPAQIIEAAQKIRKKPEQYVIGPSFDGGFYLFKGSAPVPKVVWTEVVYSRNDTLYQLMQQLKKYDRNFEFLPERRDVDTINDLGPLLEILTFHDKSELQAQRELCDWLRYKLCMV